MNMGPGLERAFEHGDKIEEGSPVELRALAAAMEVLDDLDIDHRGWVLKRLVARQLRDERQLMAEVDEDLSRISPTVAAQIAAKNAAKTTPGPLPPWSGHLPEYPARVAELEGKGADVAKLIFEFLHWSGEGTEISSGEMVRVMQEHPRRPSTSGVYAAMKLLEQVRVIVQTRGGYSGRSGMYELSPEFLPEPAPIGGVPAPRSWVDATG